MNTTEQALALSEKLDNLLLNEERPFTLVFFDNTKKEVRIKSVKSHLIAKPRLFTCEIYTLTNNPDELIVYDIYKIKDIL